VKCDDFCAKQVVAWGDVAGDLDVDLKTVSMVYGSSNVVSLLREYIPRPQQFCMSLTPHQSLSPYLVSQGSLTHAG
jgi:hypothetical protein